MYAGAARIDITPQVPVWLDGMIRDKRSQGVHDPLHARCLVIGNSPDDCHAIVAVEVCALASDTCDAARQAAARATGIAAQNIIVAATHTHSGPACFGFFNEREHVYNEWLVGRIADCVATAYAGLQPAAAGHGAATEDSISHYRRLLADDGHVVMNWELFPAERLRGALGEADPEVGVLKVTQAADPARVIALLFTHSGHPNVMSGDNLLISSDYPGHACRLLEARYGAVAMFVNGAQGSVDIDGLRDRDWEGVTRLGDKLARAVTQAADAVTPAAAKVSGARVAYTVPRRQISDEQLAWADDVLQRTGGAVTAMADGVGDDYLAVLYRQLRADAGKSISVEQVAVAVADSAWVSFPGELYTEIGMAIKRQSPWQRTYIIGLANSYAGYFPTRKAIGEGGYSEDTRHCDETAEDIIRQQSVALLRDLRARAASPQRATKEGSA